ncbi:spondin domain-containing protein [Pseudoalteromonas denitrificans]|uniref:Spondin_N n=1 Tax=Pseudoalteromonas denitrificans DSM 6059 TaxID=1123010 RepID=A0A1I1MLA3_9GAMM|nr:spondin domain-containing protein [Pseudoalteromonas denitrificans]SFC82320.1 Spondin_N [Pseudoalteromonas denitrificans DSM 6059]
MKISAFAALGLITLGMQHAQAASLDIKIKNLTQGIYYTPILIAAHPDTNHLFESGMTASTELQMMAEGGNISGLSSMLDTYSANKVENPAAGLLAPGQSAMTMLETTDGNTMLSITAMMLPTNDGFVGLDSWKIPTEAGTYTILLNAYDAGTEANNELILEGSGAPGMLGIPAAPGMGAGTNGSSVTSDEANPMVHIHRGSLGDDDMAGGKSDLNNTVHRWLNPVAKVIVTVK